LARDLYFARDMTQAQPIITQARVEAYIASALRLLCWFAGHILRAGWRGRGSRLKRALNLLERAVECILYLQAIARYGPPPKQRRIPRAAPPGFRRVQNRRRALFFKGAKVRARKAHPLARVIALLEALTSPERAVAYFFKRLCNGLRLARLVATTPLDDALAREALLSCFPPDDTS
jgi:hypothetical protein